MHALLTGTLGTINPSSLVDAKKESLIIDHRQRNENCLSHIKGPLTRPKPKGVYPIVYHWCSVGPSRLSLASFPLSNGLLLARLGTIRSLEAGTVLSFFIREAPRPRFPPSVTMKPKNDDD